jgi:hypothetical protein
MGMKDKKGVMVKGCRDGVWYYMTTDHSEDLDWFAEWVDWWVYVR